MPSPTLVPISVSIIGPTGNAQAGVSVYVLSGTPDAVNLTTVPGSPLASIFADPYGNTAINQTYTPVITGGYGQFTTSAPAVYGLDSSAFWVAAGYYTLQFVGTNGQSWVLPVKAA
jgi:hypothetical protein